MIFYTVLLCEEVHVFSYLACFMVDFCVMLKFCSLSRSFSPFKELAFLILSLFLPSS